MSASSELSLFHVVGFSGHRQLGEPAAIAGAVKAALEPLLRGAPDITSAAESHRVLGERRAPAGDHENYRP